MNSIQTALRIGSDMKLYQLAKTGNVKWIELTTKGSTLISEWGVMGGKSQRTEKECAGKNIGRANETTPAAQAKFELEAKITKKKEEGYTEKMPKTDSSLMPTIYLHSIPKSFCACKPINRTPESVEKNKDTYAQQKADGHCIILVKDDTDEVRVYSRRIEDKTEIAKNIPAIWNEAKKLSSGDMALAEFIFVRKADGKHSARAVATVIRKTKVAEALENYTEALKTGKFECRTFDLMFHGGKFIGETDYLDRYDIMKSMKLDIPEIIWDWKKEIPKAKKKLWEGFVLRVKGKGQISYTNNGKPDRRGSYKYKFLQTDDFVVLSATYGESGRHAEVYAKFNIGQYDDDGKIIEMGSVGPGTFTHEELVDLTEELNKKKRTYPFAVEIEYQEMEEDSHALKFGQIQRLRDDKPISECVFEG